MIGHVEYTIYGNSMLIEEVLAIDASHEFEFEFGVRSHFPARSAGCRIVRPDPGYQRAITGDTALRLGHFFRTSPQFWLNLQSLYDLRLAEGKVGKTLKTLRTLQH